MTHPIDADRKLFGNRPGYPGRERGSVMTWRSIKDDPPPADTPVRVGGYVKGYGDQGPLQWREHVTTVFETEQGWFGRKRIVKRYVVDEYTHWMTLPPPPDAFAAPGQSTRETKET